MDKVRVLINAADRRGMTLTEMMVSLAIFAVAMAVVFTFLVNSRRSYSDVSERVEYQQAMRGAITLISGELRTAGCDPLDTGFDRFTLADASQFQCRMDLDGDGTISVTEPAENAFYQYLPASQELTRDSGNGPQTILRNVLAFNVAYFDATGNLLGPLPLSAGDRETIRIVEITITGESDRGEPVNYVTRVLVRNG
jgi:prepilin-type N-terminal cleavage/methylation domain-containing protein